MKPSMRFVQACFVALFTGLLFLAMSNSALAQGTNSSITGRILDSSGATIAEAMVSATNLETGIARSATSDADGNYRVLQLTVGHYEVKAEKAGFSPVIQTGINLVVGQQAIVNLSLSVGAVQQTVTVSEEAPLVNTTTASVAGLVGEREVKELPLNGRSFDTLISLNAGATNISDATGAGPGKGGAAAQQGQKFAVSGRTWGENLFLLNGVEYAGPSQTASEPGGVSGQLLGVEAVREFNVVSDSYGAGYGHRAGAQINIVTQSGSNQFHGSLFEFHRNSALDSRSIFDLPTTANPTGKLPPFKRNQYGVALGGPIRKDKTFVFGNYEGFRQTLGLTQLIIVPDDQVRGTGTPGGLSMLPDVCTGVYSTKPNSTYSATTHLPTASTTINQGMKPWIDGYWPAGNGAEILNATPSSCPAGSPGFVPSGTKSGTYNPINSVQEHFGTLRLDNTFSAKDTLAGIYTHDEGTNQVPNADPLFVQNIYIRAQILSLQETHIFSPNVINSLTAGYSGSDWEYDTPAVDPNFPSSLLFSAGRNPGQLTINNGNVVNGGGSNATGQILRRHLFTLTDTVQVVRGRHQIGFGFWGARLQSNELAPNAQSGAAAFQSVYTLAAGTTSNFTFTPIQTTLYWRQWEGAWFVEDNVQFRSNLTFRIGLRHEFTDGYHEANGNGYNFLLDSTGTPITSPVKNESPLTKNNAKALFEPRVGIAWDPFGKGKMSIRAAGGIFHSTVDTLGQQFLDRMPPLNGNASFTGNFLSAVPVPPVTPVQCGVGVPQPCTTYQVFGVKSDFKIPTVYEWNLTLEQGITSNTSVRVSYVGSRGIHQLAPADPNQLPSAICANQAGCLAGGNTGKSNLVPLGTMYVPVVPTTQLLRNNFLGLGQMLFDSANSRYNAISGELVHRFGHGLDFKVAYTFSRTMDIRRGTQASGTLTNTYFAGLDYGNADDDQPHKFVFSGNYQLPLGRGKYFLSGATGFLGALASGWQLNWVATLQSGVPLNVSGGNNISGNGETGRTGNQRPNFNPSFSGDAYLHTVDHWFDANAFTQPTLAGVYPLVPRNYLRNPGLHQLNFSVLKTTRLSERFSLQLRGEAFNILNNVNLGAANATAFTSSGAISGTAGQITSINSTPRQIQLGVKVVF